MKIKLLKAAMVDVLRPIGWEGEVDDALGRSIVNNGRAIQVDAPKPKKKAAKKATTGRMRKPDQNR